MKSFIIQLLCTALLIQKEEVGGVRFETDAGPPEDGADFAPDGRVWTNGIYAVAGQFPWHVGITLLNVNGTQPPFCGGALISPDWVLTAAQCVRGVGNLELRFGSTNRSDYEQIQYSQNYNIHPFFSESNLGGEKMSRNNIALIRLGSSVELSDNVHPIGVGNFPLITSIARFAGWGKVRGSNVLSQNLMYANMAVFSNAHCQLSYVSAIESIHLCTSGATPRKTGTCEGDTGGALSVFRNDNWYVVGIAFIANDTCQYLVPPPSVYTRVSPYFEWIENTTGLNLTLEGTTLPPFTTTADPGAGSQRIQSMGYIFMLAFYVTAWLTRQ